MNCACRHGVRPRHCTRQRGVQPAASQTKTEGLVPRGVWPGGGAGGEASCAQGVECRSAVGVELLAAVEGEPGGDGVGGGPGVEVEEVAARRRGDGGDVFVRGHDIAQEGAVVGGEGREIGRGGGHGARGASSIDHPEGPGLHAQGRPVEVGGAHLVA